MMAIQAAKAHCANYRPDGSCLGIYYRDDLNIDTPEVSTLREVSFSGGQTLCLLLRTH